MARLKCLNCGNVFDKKVLTSSSTAGLSGFGFGAMMLLPIWLCVLRVYTQCPACKRTGWSKVLKPWRKIETS